MSVTTKKKKGGPRGIKWKIYLSCAPAAAQSVQRQTGAVAADRQPTEDCILDRPLCSLQGPYDRSMGDLLLLAITCVFLRLKFMSFFGRYDRCWPKAGPKALAVAEQPAAASVKSGL